MKSLLLEENGNCDGKYLSSLLIRETISQLIERISESQKSGCKSGKKKESIVSFGPFVLLFPRKIFVVKIET